MADRLKRPLILNIETSTNVCSASLTGEAGNVFSFRESKEDKSHAALLAVFIDEVMKETGASFKDIDAVAVSMGPGSYTGLRIGVSTAKGICYAGSLPLIALDTLDIITSSFMNQHKSKLLAESPNIVLCPMIDAKRMEVYMALYNKDGIKIKDTTAEIIDKETFRKLLKENFLLYYGNGAAKCSGILQSSSAEFIDGIYPTACEMGKLSVKLFHQEKFVDLAYFEPFYLKDFITTQPKKISN
jgi:tRNA threonylcarbamoyladenosine biosynthesis protein TsaB